MITNNENLRHLRILIISFSDLHSDPRVSRQIDLLGKSNDVTAVGFSEPAGVVSAYIGVPRYHWRLGHKLYNAALLKLRRFEAVYWSSAAVREAYASLADRQFDLIIANDILALPLAVRVRNRAALLFDAHEYAPLEFEESWKWRFFLKAFNHYLCQTYLAQADAMTTVCDGIGAEYLRNFDVHPQTINNAPPYADLSPFINRETDRVRLVHHGAAIPSRQIELMIQAASILGPRYTLDLMLVPSVPRYYDHLASMAKGNSRVRFLPPVPMRALPSALNRYDVGIYLLPPNNLNNRYSLPNKFFEFVQARLAIAIGPSPEMATHVKRYDMGVISEDFSTASFARAISTLDCSNISRFKTGADRAAGDLCFEKNSQKLLSLLDTLVRH